MVIDDVILGLKEQNINTVVVDGYTDRLGAESYNMGLSQRRADAVKAYFVSNGFASNQITAIGHGKADQLVACETEKGQALKDCLRPNRRVIISTK